MRPDTQILRQRVAIMLFLLTISGAVRAALLPSAHHATWSPAVSACSPSTGLSTFSIHQAPRTAMLSMVETTSALPGSARVPVRAITQWTARAVILFAFTLTPMFQFHATHLAMEWSRVMAPVLARLPTVSMPPDYVCGLLQVAAAATRARLLVLSTMFALHIAPLLPAVAVSSAAPAVLCNPLALHVGRASASAGAAAVLVCAALPPADAAPATDPTVLAIKEEEVEPVLPPVHTSVRCPPPAPSE